MRTLKSDPLKMAVILAIDVQQVCIASLGDHHTGSVMGRVILEAFRHLGPSSAVSSFLAPGGIDRHIQTTETGSDVNTRSAGGLPPSAWVACMGRRSTSSCHYHAQYHHFPVFDFQRIAPSGYFHLFAQTGIPRRSPPLWTARLAAVRRRSRPNEGHHR